MKKNSFAEAFYRNAGYIVVALVSVVYVASSLINISKSGKSIYEIIATGVLSLIVGVLINGVFRSVGIRRGDEDERTVATSKLHAEVVEEITPYIDRLDSFCQEENKRVLKEIRTRILAGEGMKYTDYFDEEGGTLGAPSVGEKKALRAKRRTYFKALRVKAHPLLSSNLTSDGAKPYDPFDFGRSKKEYTSQKNAGDILVKLLMAVVFGYFGVTLASEINVASIIWNSLQIVLYITGGIIQMYFSYMWVVDDYRGSVVKKIDYLQKFKGRAAAQEWGSATEAQRKEI